MAEGISSSALPNRTWQMTGPTMLVPNASVCGAGVNICSLEPDVLLHRRPARAAVFLRQCETAQPFLFRMRVQRTRSSLARMQSGDELLPDVGGKVLLEEGSRLLAKGVFLPA